MLSDYLKERQGKVCFGISKPAAEKPAVKIPLRFTKAEGSG
jgi:hypothetical protein